LNQQNIEAKKNGEILPQKSTDFDQMLNLFAASEKAFSFFVLSKKATPFEAKEEGTFAKAC
jgi:hypothetical protein